MYRVYCNNSPLYDLRDEDLVLISPIIKIGENTAGLLNSVFFQNIHTMKKLMN